MPITPHTAALIPLPYRTVVNEVIAERDEVLDALEKLMADPDSVDTTAEAHSVLSKHNRMKR